MKADFNTLKIVHSDGIAQVILNRPKQRNAISHEMQREIDVALDEAELDPEVRAVLLRGEGVVFSAGHDLNEQMAGNSFPARTFPFASPSIEPRLPRAWYFRKPLIGAIHGFVGPYAVAIVACCDFNIAAEDTRFSCEIFRGTYPDVGWLPLYMQLPMRVIEKLFLMGGWMDAEQALQFQFVQRVVPEDELLDEALRWAKHASMISPSGFSYGKERIRRSIELLGLSSLPSVLTQYGPPHLPEGFDFPGAIQEHGMKEAVRLRDEIFDPSIARV
jgi:enoyl-CoA hydratase/carnithine racemase